MKTAGVCSILRGSRTQWGWREVGAAEAGSHAGWTLAVWELGAACAVCRAWEPVCQGWGEGGSPVWQGLRNHGLALVRTLVKTGSLVWAVRMDA